MPDDANIKFNPNLEKEITKDLEKHVGEMYIIVKRTKSILGKTSGFELLDAFNCSPDPSKINELVDEETFEGSEVFGGDPDVRKIRFRVNLDK